MTISIIPIRTEHVEGFHAALDIVARERRYLALTEAPPLESVRAFVEDCIAKGYTLFVAAADGRVVGGCDIIPFARSTQRHAGNLGLWLLPSYRGQGLGWRLLSAAVERARDSGLSRVELTVYDDNANAIALYHRVGFQHEGVKRNATLIDGAYKNLIMMAIADLDQWSAP